MGILLLVRVPHRSVNAITLGMQSRWRQLFLSRSLSCQALQCLQLATIKLGDATNFGGDSRVLFIELVSRALIAMYAEHAEFW
jgi:hypothetical protein